MKLKLILLVTLLLPLLNLSAETASPKVRVQETVEQVVDALNTKEYPSAEARKKAVLQIVDQVFDFEEMSKRSLGSAWTKYATEDQQSFVSAFSDFLAETYLNRIEKVSNDMVAIESEQVRGDKALVKTKVQLKDSKFPIDYKMHLADGAWSVYDVVIENVGLVANYRNEFAGFLRKEELPALTKKLIDKTATLK